MKLKKPLPKHAALAGIVVGGLVVLLVGWMVVVSPQGSKAADLKKQTESVQQQISSNLAAVAAARNASASTVPQIRVADVYKLAKAMPSTTDIPDLLIELSQVTKDSGVDLQTLSPGQPAADPAGGMDVPVTLNVDGDFYTVTDLLYRLRTLVSVRHGALQASGRLFSIDNVTLSPSAGTRLTAAISMHAFVYGAPAVAAPAPASTTGTDTSSTTTTPSPNTPPNSPSAAGAP